MGRAVDRELAAHALWCRAWTDALYLRNGLLSSDELRDRIVGHWMKRIEQRQRRKARARRKSRRGWA